MEQPWKPTSEQLEAAANQTIPDVIGPELSLLFVGINPSLYSAATGHHFARPGNRFWPSLYRGGITDRQLSPFEDQRLLDFGCGITNMVARATRRADELSSQEVIEGGELLASKVEDFQIRQVVFLGVTAYRQAFQAPQTKIGRQGRTTADATTWVLPNPSGLNAHYQIDDFARLFRELVG